MNVKLLIDGIVRQTTVLLAQLSTTAGSRAPLARVTDEVFRNLAREIEAQGVGRPVVADMFGMALRSYQRKVQRLAEGATQRDRTLWEAVLEFVQDERPTRARVLERFANDGEKEVVSVLTDLVKTGLVFTTGSGRGAVYVPTQDDVRRAVMRDHDRESIENWLWLMVFRKEVRTRSDAHRALACEATLVNEAIEELVATGRLSWQGDELKSSNLVIPLGAEQGWETAVLDHFRTVAVAIAKKGLALAASRRTMTKPAAPPSRSRCARGTRTNKTSRRCFALHAAMRRRCGTRWQSTIVNIHWAPRADVGFRSTWGRWWRN